METYSTVSNNRTYKKAISGGRQIFFQLTYHLTKRSFNINFLETLVIILIFVVVIKTCHALHYEKRDAYKNKLRALESTFVALYPRFDTCYAKTSFMDFLIGILIHKNFCCKFQIVINIVEIFFVPFDYYLLELWSAFSKFFPIQYCRPNSN